MGGYPEIIHLNRIFHYKPTILGILHLWNPPYEQLRTRSHISRAQRLKDDENCCQPNPAMENLQGVTCESQ